MADSLGCADLLTSGRMTPSASEDEDALLVAAAQERPEAFGALYERHVDAVYRYLRLHAGEAEAADLTQEVFLRAFASLPRYRARGLPFAAWLFRIARNLTADHFRMSRRTPGNLLPEVAQPNSAATPEEAALQAEAYGRIRSLIVGLDRSKRELLALRFAAGLSSRQIAMVTGRSEAAIKKQMARILRVLQESCG